MSRRTGDLDPHPSAFVQLRRVVRGDEWEVSGIAQSRHSSHKAPDPPRRNLALGQPHHRRAQPDPGTGPRLTSSNQACQQKGGPRARGTPPTRRDSRATGHSQALKTATRRNLRPSNQDRERSRLNGRRKSLPSLLMVSRDLTRVLRERYPGERVTQTYIRELQAISQAHRSPPP